MSDLQYMIGEVGKVTKLPILRTSWRVLYLEFFFPSTGNRCFESPNMIKFATGPKGKWIWKCRPCVYVHTAHTHLCWDDEAVAPVLMCPWTNTISTNGNNNKQWCMTVWDVLYLGGDPHFQLKAEILYSTSNPSLVEINWLCVHLYLYSMWMS